jgi:hypothetical protein
MILVELMFAIMLAVVVLTVVPLLLLMAGVAGVVLLWAIAPTAVLVALVLWLAFPHAMGVAALLFVLMIGFLGLTRRHQVPMNAGIDARPQFRSARFPISSHVIFAWSSFSRPDVRAILIWLNAEGADVS